MRKMITILLFFPLAPANAQSANVIEWTKADGPNGGIVYEAAGNAGRILIKP